MLSSYIQKCYYLVSPVQKELESLQSQLKASQTDLSPPHTQSASSERREAEERLRRLVKRCELYVKRHELLKQLRQQIQTLQTQSSFYTHILVSPLVCIMCSQLCKSILVTHESKKNWALLDTQSSACQQCTQVPISSALFQLTGTLLEHECTKNKKIPDRTLHLFILVCSELRKPQLQAKRESCV